MLIPSATALWNDNDGDDGDDGGDDGDADYHGDYDGLPAYSHHDKITPW